MDQEEPKRIVKVVVLGDIGRSPRMQYHSLSLANNGFKVIIIGYMDTLPIPDISKNQNISIAKLHPLVFEHGPKLLQYALKAFWQTVSLLFTLLVTGNCHFVFCQNPPAIPTLPVCRFYCLVTKSKFIIDWHNYAYSVMALSLPQNSYLLTLSTKLERYFGQAANHNFCVTYAMKEDLIDSWDIMATVLYDRPPHIFHPITLKEKHDWFVKIGQQYAEFTCSGREQLNNPSDVASTAFTRLTGDIVEIRNDRPGLLFSSTSWTPDEDFKILLEALQAYETTYELTKKLPKLICVITGKGPMKQDYIRQLSLKSWQHVKVVTPWLEAQDYPTMVASADLGVCLHTSSSGLDLPMKVVDMFGAGLPVCAYEFNCLHELVKNGVTGYTFKNSAELSKQIVTWFENFPHNEEQNKIHQTMKDHIAGFRKDSWEENWNLRAKKIFIS